MSDLQDRVRTPLLTLLTEEALDRDYQAAADARAGTPASRGRSRWVVAPVAVGFALLVTVAAVQTSRNADDTDASRAALIERIEARRDAVQDDQARLEELRAANVEAEQIFLGLGDDLASAENRRGRLAATTGFLAVTGPGIRISFDNTELTAPDNRIRDSDIAMLVDSLWLAGAEAIAVNGQRLTVRSGIRNSGVPIEVNGVGIAPPYTIDAVGDVDRLAADFIVSDPGQDFLALVGQFAFVYEVDTMPELRLPAAPARLLRLRSATDPTTTGSGARGVPEGGVP